MTSRTDKEIIQDFLRGSEEVFKLFDRRFEKLIEKHYRKDMDSFFKDDNFNRFFQQWDPFEQMSSGQSHWMETPKERVLIVKVETSEEAPVEINIEDGKIIISGKVITESGFGKRVQSFKKVFGVPNDVHSDKAIFENNEGEILIKFPKKKAGKAPTRKPERPLIKRPNRPGVRPLQPKSGDITI